jgi:hypothetical protein
VLPVNVGCVMLGEPDAYLRDAHRWKNAAGSPPAGVVIEARVVDDTASLMWYGDLDLAESAEALQRAADLLALPVHVTDEHHRWPCTHDEGLQWCQRAPLRTFLPRTTVCHPWARLHTVKQPTIRRSWPPTHGGSTPAVKWQPFGRIGPMSCVMRFGPGIADINDEPAASEIAGTHPGLAAAAQSLVEETIQHLERGYLHLGTGVDVRTTIERYVARAVAQLSDIPEVVDAWRHTTAHPTLPKHRTYGCRCFRTGPSRATS